MHLSLPSKTFLLGEYAVLEGGHALLLGHQPNFEASLVPGPPAHSFHAESPAGRWLKAHPAQGTLTFRDPHRGAGGFGGSGAEFVAAFATGHTLPTDSFWSNKPRQRFAWLAWEASRDFPGSGADVLTQAYGINLGQEFLLGIDIENKNLEDIRPGKLGLTLSLFHTGRKLATHEHVNEPRRLPFDELQEHTVNALEALRASNGRWFAQCLDGYGVALARAGLLAPHSAQALGALPEEHVLAAKGCGAMGADVLAVLHEGASLAAWAAENSLAEARSLRL